MSEVNEGPIKSPTLEQFAEMLLESVRSGRELQGNHSEWAEEMTDYSNMHGDRIGAAFSGDVDLTRWTIRLKPTTLYCRVRLRGPDAPCMAVYNSVPPGAWKEVPDAYHDFEVEQ